MPRKGRRARANARKELVDSSRKRQDAERKRRQQREREEEESAVNSMTLEDSIGISEVDPSYKRHLNELRTSWDKACNNYFTATVNIGIIKEKIKEHETIIRNLKQDVTLLKKKETLYNKKRQRLTLDITQIIWEGRIRGVIAQTMADVHKVVAEDEVLNYILDLFCTFLKGASEYDQAFDKEKHNDNIRIEADGLEAIKGDNLGSTFMSAMGNLEMSNGEHYWEIEIVRMDPGRNLMIGIVGTQFNAKNTTGAYTNRTGCFFYTCNQSFYVRGSNRNVNSCRQIRIRDRIGVHLKWEDDRDATCEFYLNDTKIPNSKQTALAGKYRLCVDVYQSGDHVRILNKPPPVD